ncbi:fibrobacter succinogenes major paralogous domain-containing protein [Flavobacterium sp. UBA6026]|uniref:fibrobacter succinogenes major paralogous domain-containing protein n=1 Tax=Flavobacterium sp. UBA6026 TaxID=1946550 RepID=UPI0025B7F429|nr:fibrobacter succinogenes major paralogous domain-containing protein [Flavobacterium sp. UBA6026]
MSCSKDDANNSPSGSSATVTIGSQIWMKKNLDVDKYRNGDLISQVQDALAWANLTTGAWCYYSNDVARGAIYGKLYNWYAVNDSRGLVPTGYHIPTDSDWSTLIITNSGGVGTAGGILKEAGTTHWDMPNTDATNSSGFTGLPGGQRDFGGNFNNVGVGSFWWSSTEIDAKNALTISLYYGDGTVRIMGPNKVYGFSVRCIKD